MTILEQMKKLEKKYSNDMDFGRIIRDLIRTIDTEVKEAANTDITTYYSSGKVTGHLGAT